MILAEFGTGQVLWSLIWLFMFIIWFWLLMVIFGDIFRDKDLSGWGKAAWSIFVIFAPYLGIFVYLIVRGHGMSDRAIASAKAQQAQMDAYTRDTASSQSPADQIESAKRLLDNGAITQAEFEKLKRDALA